MILKRKIFKSKLFRNIFLLCLGTLIVVPAIDILYIYPLFHQVLFDALEEETELSAKNLLELSFNTKASECKAERLPKDIDSRAQRLVRENKLIMLKIYDKSGKIVYSTKSELIGTRHPEKFFYEIVSKGKCLTQFILRSDVTLEHEFLKEDVVESYVPIMKGGQFCGAFEIYHNVTESKAKMDAVNAFVCTILVTVTLGLITLVLIITRQLEKTKLQLRMLTQTVEYSPHGILIMSKKGVIEAVNPKFTETTGYKPNELIGRRLSDIYFRTPEDYREIWDTITLGKEVYVEWENKKKNGEKYWVRSSILLIRGENGTTSHILGIFEDVTTEKQIQHDLNDEKTTFKSVINSINDGIFTTDSNGRITSFNKSLEKVFGYRSSEVIGENISLILPSFSSLIVSEKSKELQSDESLSDIIGQQKNGTSINIKIALNEIELGNKTVFTGIVRNLLN